MKVVLKMKSLHVSLVEKAKCLAGTSGCFGCGKGDHKVRDCPIIASRGRKSKQIAPTIPKDDVPTERHLYALRTRGTKPDENGDDDEGKFLHFRLVI